MASQVSALLKCESEGGATWLQINVTGAVNDNRPIVSANLGATWGLHLHDVNPALENLVQDVSTKEKAYHEHVLGLALRILPL